MGVIHMTCKKDFDRYLECKGEEIDNAAYALAVALLRTHPDQTNEEILPWDMSVRINTSALACNDRSLDAFCAVADVEGGQGSLGVTLTRVLARINIVSDALPSGVEASGLELSDVCTGFDFKTWDVTGERAGLGFPGSACTSLPETVSGKTTLAFAYVFAPAAADFRAGLTLTLAADGGRVVEQRSLSDVPLRANHLTNIQYSNR